VVTINSRNIAIPLSGDVRSTNRTDPKRDYVKHATLHAGITKDLTKSQLLASMANPPPLLAELDVDRQGALKTNTNLH